MFKELTWAGTIGFTDNVCHASLVAEESSQMNWLRWIVFWESLDFATMSSGSLLWVECHWTMARRRKFTMRLKIIKYNAISSSAQNKVRLCFTEILSLFISKIKSIFSNEKNEASAKLAKNVIWKRYFQLDKAMFMRGVWNYEHVAGIEDSHFSLSPCAFHRKYLSQHFTEITVKLILFQC